MSDFLSQLTFVEIFNFCIFVVFTLCYAYQLFYVLVVLCKKTPKLSASRNHKFAAVISARNESAVIGCLIKSIKEQNYPEELIDVFVIADNCTDNTADIAREAGAKIITRFNKEKIGKGYALEYGFDVLLNQYGDCGHEAYFIFDADNVLDPNYFREMNKVFDSGAMASTCYRNAKNFDSNWISAGYGVWFAREAKYLSQARLLLNSSCAISGTGFYIAADVIRQHGGWKWQLLTEDIEFSSMSIVGATRISYCPTAMVYDEQPVTFRDSWNQRFRWSRGFYQVFWRYGKSLLKGIFTQKKGYKFACYDMLMTIAPGMLLAVTTVIINLIILALALCGTISTDEAIYTSLEAIAFCLGNFFGFMFFYGALTMITEHRKFHASTATKVRAVFTFPFFMLTYIPIAVAALFSRSCAWKPIAHTISVDAKTLSNSEEKKK